MPKSTNGGEHAALPTARAKALLSVKHLSEMLDCSARTVYRLADAGRMPAPVKLGALVRWSTECIEQWIQSGCHCRSEQVL